MRHSLAILLLCACARSAADPVAASNGDISDAADAGAPSDAGPLEGGTAFAPLVGADAGPMSVVIAPEPDSACASWLPQPTEPESRSLTTEGRLYWHEIVSNGRGDLAAGLEQTWATVAFLSDSGLSIAALGGGIVPQASSFLFDRVGGPCMICDSTLINWPGGGEIYLGDGYDFSRNCTYAPRSEGGGVYLSCFGPVSYGQAPNPTFERYDEFLNLVSSQPGDGLYLIATDTRDRILEVTVDETQGRWLDSSGHAISEFFPERGLDTWTRPARLIGGGFLDRHGRIIPSGSANLSQAPAWLTRRKSVSIVLGGRAYALGDDDCGLEIRDPDGQLCGTISFINCRVPPQPGLDGTIAFPMNFPGYFTDQTVVSWPGLLR